MKIQKIMTTNVASILAHHKLSDAAKIMQERDCGALPVIDTNEFIVGMITDRDIAMAAYTKDRRIADIQVSEAMSKSPLSCQENDDLHDIEKLMQTHQIRRVPVVDKKNHVVGIISVNDIALAYKSKANTIRADEVANTFAAICTHRMSESAFAEM